MDMSDKLSEVPPELQVLYNTLYDKIILIIGGHTIDLKNDSTVLRVLIQTVMVIVENAKDVNGQGWNGPEKKRIALSLIKFVIHDLAVKGKIDPITAADIISNIDLFGGVAMDLAIDVAKGMFDIGQHFVEDAKKTGCKASCRKNCCFGF
jgi:hypothetical protein